MSQVSVPLANHMVVGQKTKGTFRKVFGKTIKDEDSKSAVPKTRFRFDPTLAGLTSESCFQLQSRSL